MPVDLIQGSKKGSGSGSRKEVCPIGLATWIGTPSGVHEARTVERFPPEMRSDPDLSNAITGLQWLLCPSEYRAEEQSYNVTLLELIQLCLWKH